MLPNKCFLTFDFEYLYFVKLIGMWYKFISKIIYNGISIEIMKMLSCQCVFNCIKLNLSRKRRKLYILLILIIVFLERSYEIIRKYQKHPTYIETHFVPQYHASFPAITVCALHGYKSEVLEVKS